MRWGRARGGGGTGAGGGGNAAQSGAGSWVRCARYWFCERVDAAHAAAAVMSYEIEAWVAHYHPMLRVQAWGGPLSPHAASLHTVMLACFPPSADRALCVRIRTIPLDMEERASRRPK